MSEDVFKLDMPRKTYFGVGAVRKVREAVKDCARNGVARKTQLERPCLNCLGL